MDESVNSLADLGDLNLLPVFEALFQGDVYIWNQPDGTRLGVLGGEKIVTEGGALVPLFHPYGKKPIPSPEGGQVTVPVDQLEEVVVGRRLRIALKQSMDSLQMRADLKNPDSTVRRSAATRLGNSGTVGFIPLLKKILDGETDKWVRYTLEESIHRLTLLGENPEEKKSAIRELGEMGSQNALPALRELAAAPSDGSGDPEVSDLARESIRRIESWERTARWISIGFTGLSLSSILMIMALGLAIIFGLMGVINMAHGELMMLGAYTTYVIQGLFQSYLPPAAFNFYFFLSLPVSFLAVAVFGWCLERGIIKHLYGRALETLLVTWGLSLILQQAVRQFFGAANVDLITPDWLRSGVQVAVGIYFPYNRLFIIGLTVLIVVGVYYLLMRSHPGLMIQAVTQNREMSMCLGISSGKVDAYTFALGAGLAGIAGCALTLIGNVGPDLGQNYIVDSFMVVVFGGVGKLAGTIFAALGIGGLNKLIEPGMGAVFGKVLVLVLLILFLQKRPSGLFPAKGRYGDV
jgi:urea transport system permease protein